MLLYIFEYRAERCEEGAERDYAEKSGVRIRELLHINTKNRMRGLLLVFMRKEY